MGNTSNWKKMYEENMSKVDSDYSARKKHLNDAQTSELGALQEQFDTGAGKLKQSRNEALSNAFITRRQGERMLPSLLGRAGGSGGFTESTASRFFRTQQKANIAANSQYSNDHTALSTNFATNKAGVKSKYGQMLADAEKEKDQRFLELAQFAYQAQERERQEALERQRFEEQKRAQAEAERLAREQFEEQKRIQAALEAAQAAAAAASRNSYSSGGGGGYARSSPSSGSTRPSGSYLGYGGSGNVKPYTKGNATLSSMYRDKSGRVVKRWSDGSVTYG